MKEKFPEWKALVQKPGIGAIIDLVPTYEYHYKRVKCIETGEVFESEFYFKKICTIPAALSGEQKTAYGLHWEYTDEKPTNTDKTLELIEKNGPTKKVICLTTGEIYKNLDEASEKTGIYKAGISRCCRGISSQTHGLQFQYLREEHKFESKLKLIQIECVETGEIFNGIKEAIERFNTPNEQTISRVLTGKRKSYKGFHLRYYVAE